MPTYEYACRSCGQHVEVAQAFTDPPLTSCPNCGGELRKVFGNVGIVLKGSGFYKTDSRNATGKKGSAPKHAFVSFKAGDGTQLHQLQQRRSSAAAHDARRAAAPPSTQESTGLLQQDDADPDAHRQ